MNKLIIGCSPITSEIFAGKLNKAGNMWVGKKENVTDTAVSAVAQHLVQRNEEMEFHYKGKKFVIRVSEIE